jgi:hypothetical protein
LGQRETFAEIFFGRREVLGKTLRGSQCPVNVGAAFEVPLFFISGQAGFKSADRGGIAAFAAVAKRQAEPGVNVFGMEAKDKRVPASGTGKIFQLPENISQILGGFHHADRIFGAPVIFVSV